MHPPPSGPAATTKLPWPDGWPRPWIREAMGCGAALFGILLVAVAVLGTADTLGDWPFHQTLSMGLVTGGFGAALIFSASLSFPLLDRGVPPRLATVQDHGVSSTGVALPSSRPRVVRKIAGGIALCVCGVGLLLAGRWMGVVLGVPLLVGGGVGAIRPLRHGAGRGWQLVLVPQGVLHKEGRVRTFVPWDHVLEVRTYKIGASDQRYGPPGLGLLVDNRAMIDTTLGPLGRLILRHWFSGVDLSYPIDVLAVDPALVYAALCYYTTHPQARAELGNHRGLQRLLRQELR